MPPTAQPGKTGTPPGKGKSEVYLPAVGGSVRVRPIPPSLARQLEDRATKNGKLDYNELQMLRFKYGVVEPNFTVDEVRAIFLKHGPSVHLVLRVIDEISPSEQVVIADGVPRKYRGVLRAACTATRVQQRHRAARTPGLAAARTTRRPRERREQRHTARSTSSGDSGDSDSDAPGEAGLLQRIDALSHQRQVAWAARGERDLTEQLTGKLETLYGELRDTRKGVVGAPFYGRTWRTR